ncbi:bestrophin-like domain [Methylobacterium sp. CM6244]
MPMLTFWLDQPIWLIFGSLACLVLAWCLMLITLTNTKRTRPFIVGVSTGIAPAFVGVVSVLLSLLIGFVANDAWERQRQASRVVQTESAQARAVYNLSRSVSKDLPDFRILLADYIESIVDEEWPAMAKGGKASSRADHAFGKLLQAVVAPNFDVVVGKANHSALLAAVLNLQTARSERLALSEMEGDDSKWVTLFALSALALLVIAAIHLERPSSQAASLSIFGSALVITLGVIAMHERPFDGPLALGPSLLDQVRTLVVAAG